MAAAVKFTLSTISIHALREEGDCLLLVSRISSVISIHALREEGDLREHGVDETKKISIHALREEGDASPPPCWRSSNSISIHALREEGDPRRPRNGHDRGHFYPRPPRGGRLLLFAGLAVRWYFYPRPPRGGRHTTLFPFVKRFLFLSTPSARRATAKTETKSLFSNKLYNILHEFRRALIYNGSKSYPNHAK